MASRPPIFDPAESEVAAPLVGTRAQSLQRLQVGGSLLLGIILIVGLANVIEQRAKQSEQEVVPEAAATVAPDAEATSGKDPLADAGVVPEMPTGDEAGAPPDATNDGGQ